jgi:hypothetical protein
MSGAEGWKKIPTTNDYDDDAGDVTCQQRVSLPPSAHSERGGRMKERRLLLPTLISILEQSPVI